MSFIFKKIIFLFFTISLSHASSERNSFFNTIHQHPEAFKNQRYHKKSFWLPHLNAHSPLIQNLKKIPLRKEVDISPAFPAPFNQKEFPSCTSHSLIASVLYELIKQNYTTPKKAYRVDKLSVLYLHYKAHSYDENMPKENPSGVDIRDAVEVLINHGICLESLYPYDQHIERSITPQMDESAAKFRFTESKLVNEGEVSSILDVENIASLEPTLENIKCILNANCPVIGAMYVFNSTSSDTALKTGIFPMPAEDETSRDKAHAIVIAGYDDSKKAFLIHNSWGTELGTKAKSNHKGYFLLPYDYVDADLTFDLYKVGHIDLPDMQAPFYKWTYENNPFQSFGNSNYFFASINSLRCIRRLIGQVFKRK